MPQHAVSASQDRVEDENAVDRQGNALPDAHHEPHTFSPPLAGNDVAAFDNMVDHPISDAVAQHAGDGSEKPQDGNNDNLPSGRALVILDGSGAIAAAGQNARTNVSRPVVVIGVLTLLGLGAAAFSYNGLAEQKETSTSQAQLASVPASLPEANTIVPLRSAPETNTVSLAAASPLPEVAPAAAATAQPESALTAPAPQEITAAVAAEPAPQPSAVLPEPIPARAAVEPASAPAQEETPAATLAPQITPSNLASTTAAQPARSVTPLPTGPGRGQFVFVQRPNVNIRNAPSDRGQIIGIAQFGGRFVVARSDGEWVQVAQGPWRGWINQRFLGPRLPRG